LPAASHVALSAAPSNASSAYAGVGLNIPPVVSAAGPTQRVRRKNLPPPPLPPPPSEDDLKIINTTNKNIEKIKDIILPKLKSFIKTQLCKTIPAKYSTFRTLLTPEIYTIKTEDEILNAAIQFILTQLGNMSKITEAYPAIKTSFPKLGFYDFLIARALPKVAQVRAQMTQQDEDKTKRTREAVVLETIGTILKASSITCTKEGLPDLEVDAIVNKVFQNIFKIIDPRIFDREKRDRPILDIRYKILKIIHPEWSLNIKLKKLLKETKKRKNNITARRNRGETVSKYNSATLDTDPTIVVITPEQTKNYWLILNAAKEKLNELRISYGS